MKYGDLPVSLGIHDIKVSEMFFYQYLPIKLSGEIHPIYENRLNIFDLIIGRVCCDFIGEFGLDKYKESSVYLTAKHLFQKPNCEFNRPGFHSDGFLSDDINYIWCNNNPTTFNTSDFDLSNDHDISLSEMDSQAIPSNNIRYEAGELLRLNQFNIHKVSEVKEPCMRAFLKLSFSPDKYNLIGNWHIKELTVDRNNPTK
jgi:hypothetical protein